MPLNAETGNYDPAVDDTANVFFLYVKGDDGSQKILITERDKQNLQNLAGRHCCMLVLATLLFLFVLFLVWWISGPF